MERTNIFRLDRSKPLALYYQIAEVLRQRIAEGVLKPGETIPTEAELQQLFGVSRGTVRQAVRELVNDGLVRLAPPHGTFVTKLKLQEDLPELISFSVEVRQQGLMPTSRVLAVGIEPAPPDVAERLRIAQGAPTLHLDRVRGANHEPVALMYSHIAGWVGLDPLDDYADSLNALLGERGIRLVDADQIIEATVATVEAASLLACRPGTPLLKIDRVTIDTSGRFVERVVAFYRADRYAYHIRLRPPSSTAGLPLTPSAMAQVEPEGQELIRGVNRGLD